MYRRPGWVWRALSVVLPIVGELWMVTMVASECGTRGKGTVAAALLWWALRSESWERWVIEEL